MASSKMVFFNESKDGQRFYNLLKQLRPHLTLEEFEKTYSEAKTTNQYQLVGIEEGHELIALMGFRFLNDFVHGRHLYIDDLVSSEMHRSKGYGAILLNYAEKVATENDCSNLRLCTGIENERGKTFYSKHGWNLRAVVYKKKL